MAFDRDEWMRRLGPLYPGLIAIKCVTQLPLARSLVPADDDLARSAWWFAVVGFALGAALAIAAWLLGMVGLTGGIAAGVVVLVAVALTRGRYETGLARTADALSGAPGDDDTGDDRRADAMRVTAIGAIAIFAALGLRALGLAGTDAAAWTAALVVSQMSARWSVLFLTKIGDHLEHPVGARAPLLIGDYPWSSLAIATALTAALSFLVAGWLGLGALVVVAALAFAVGLACQRWLGGFTSESLAAASAACELAVFVVFAAARPAVEIAVAAG